MKKYKIFLTLSLFKLISVVGLANAQMYIVNNLNDTGVGSLREAIIKANTQTSATIKFDSSLKGSINLQKQLPPITIPVTISGNTNVVLNAKALRFKTVTGSESNYSDTVSILNFTVTATGSTIKNIKITGFNDTLNASYFNLYAYFYGIYSLGNLTVDSCCVDSNMVVARTTHSYGDGYGYCYGFYVKEGLLTGCIANNNSATGISKNKYGSIGTGTCYGFYIDTDGGSCTSCIANQNTAYGYATDAPQMNSGYSYCFGFYVNSNNITLTNCMATNNYSSATGSGFGGYGNAECTGFYSKGGDFYKCLADSNIGRSISSAYASGFQIDSGFYTFRNCTANSNDALGIGEHYAGKGTGFYVQRSSGSFINCIANYNIGTVRASRTSGNGYGFYIYDGKGDFNNCIANNNRSDGSVYGFRIHGESSFVNCEASDNIVDCRDGSSTKTSYGFSVQRGRFVNCIANNNTANGGYDGECYGFSVDSAGASFMKCIANNNTGCASSDFGYGYGYGFYIAKDDANFTKCIANNNTGKATKEMGAAYGYGFCINSGGGNFIESTANNNNGTAPISYRESYGYGFSVQGNTNIVHCSSTANKGSKGSFGVYATGYKDNTVNIYNSIIYGGNENGLDIYASVQATLYNTVYKTTKWNISCYGCDFSINPMLMPCNNTEGDTLFYKPTNRQIFATGDTSLMRERLIASGMRITQADSAMIAIQYDLLDSVRVFTATGRCVPGVIKGLVLVTNSVHKDKVVKKTLTLHYGKDNKTTEV